MLDSKIDCRKVHRFAHPRRQPHYTERRSWHSMKLVLDPRLGPMAAILCHRFLHRTTRRELDPVFGRSASGAEGGIVRAKCPAGSGPLDAWLGSRQSYSWWEKSRARLWSRMPQIILVTPLFDPNCCMVCSANFDSAER